MIKVHLMKSLKDFCCYLFSSLKSITSLTSIKKSLKSLSIFDKRLEASLKEIEMSIEALESEQIELL